MSEQSALERSDRAIRAYAYLTASFRVQNDVNDVLDCIVPFVSAVALRDVTKPIAVADISEALSKYGLKIPLYVITQLLPRLAKRGLLEWSQVAKAYLPVPQKVEDQTKDINLEVVFTSLEPKIAAFASNLGVNSVPFSTTWGDALVNFLRSEKAKSGLKSIIHKEAIVSHATEIESFLMARFIQSSREYDRSVFDQISQVYTGVLIEDFIGNVQTLGVGKDYKGLSIFYDTPVLLRILGTSGDLLRTATLEMHSNLRDLGCNLYYFDVNRAEAANILDTIISAHGHGHEIFGETAEAIFDGDITIAEIKDLSATFETRLGHLNIFPFEYNYSARKQEDVHQIDEMAFVAALESAALKGERSYKRENAVNDAHALAMVLRLRRGRTYRDIASCKYLFVSRNSLLQRVSRKFCIDHLDEYDDSSSPAVLTLGQVTTAGWLATANALEPHKVSQELLANCYAAVKPSPAWADEFAKAIDEFSAEDRALISERADAILILKATREAARDESLNEPAILRKINVAEKFRLAKIAADEAEDRRIRELRAAADSFDEELRKVAKDTETNILTKSAADLAAAISNERERTLREAEDNRVTRNRERADVFAKRMVRISQIGIVVLFLMPLFIEKFNPFGKETFGDYILIGSVLFVTTLAVFDLSGLKPVTRTLDKLRNAISDAYFYFLEGGKLD